jgi:single-strand DNA-binding protein
MERTNIMQSLNQMQALGNLGKEIEMRFTPSGREVTTGSIAMNRKYRAGDEVRQEVEWINWEAWGNLAKIINEYAKPGQKVFLQGRIKTDKFESKNHPGENVYRTKLVVLECILLGSGSSEQRIVADENSQGDVAEIPAEDDIPF